MGYTHWIFLVWPFPMFQAIRVQRLGNVIRTSVDIFSPSVKDFKGEDEATD